MPAETTQNGFSFGMAMAASDDAKEILYPHGGDMEERVGISAQYLKTHGNFKPGEQKNRQYNMPFDKTNHSFGYGE
jgi:hypothetical protein